MRNNNDRTLNVIKAIKAINHILKYHSTHKCDHNGVPISNHFDDNFAAFTLKSSVTFTFTICYDDIRASRQAIQMNPIPYPVNPLFSLAFRYYQ
jgi:hypothetical protein